MFSRIKRGWIVLIIIKCDNCKKIINWQDLQHQEYNLHYLTSTALREDKHLCSNCKVHLSERYDKKYHELKRIHSETLKQLSTVKKSCAEYKKLSKEELQKTAKVIFT